MNSAQIFLRDQWYVAAESAELVAEGAPLGRILLNEPVVFYRTRDGRAVALEDRCCHRRAPLSRGKVLGDQLRCGYHGIVYDSGGRVVSVPGQDRLPPGAELIAYRTAERHGYVWIWMGEAERANEAAIPDFHWNTAEGWTSGGGILAMRCNYLMLVDNLLDLSHVPFLHENSVGSTNDTNPELSWERGADFVRGTRIARNLVATPRLQSMGVTSNIDTFKVMTFHPPAHVTLEITQTEANLAEGATPRFSYRAYILNSMTPETPTSCHYFWRNARDWQIEDAKLTEFLCAATARAFAEDKEMLEATQRIIDLNPDRREIDFNSDIGGLQARRIVDQLLAAERASFPKAQSPAPNADTAGQ
jgi:phenylpropionate dioxygenase-like ring-hydroxylating dioxygenase large terminal subunit